MERVRERQIEKIGTKLDIENKKNRDRKKNEKKIR